MGMLPIALAIVGFVFLWAIVNYNSLKQKHDALNKVHYDLREIARQRHTFLLLVVSALQKPLPEAVIPTLDALRGYLSESEKTAISINQEISVSEHISSLQEKSTILQAGGAKGQSLEDLFQENDRMLQKIRQYRIIKKHYNELVVSIPTRFIAGISGFHVK